VRKETFDSDGVLRAGLSSHSEEKFLKERVELFRSAFENSTDAIVITNVDGEIIEVNDAFTKIFGYSREDAVGESTALIRSRHSTPEFYKQMWDSLTRSNQWKGEIINRRKDGTEIPVWLSITPIFLPDDHARGDGTKIGYMGIESDISERKNLEQQIIQTEKLATIGQLAAGIAHEIGTPLNIISGNAELVQLDMRETDPGYQELTTIIEQTRRISGLIKQLLDFARPKILSLQLANVNAIITSVLDFVRLQFSRNGIDIETALENDLSQVYGDPALLYQVFLNIIINALQAMTKGGKLYLQTHSEHVGTGAVNEDREKVVITVKDTGEGIPEENIQKLFTPFFTTKQPGKGTGLGLAVTNRIVQEHNGTIEIDSEVGKGTVVTISFNAFRQK
jgi:PAS domain S-box-containing protein